MAETFTYEDIYDLLRTERYSTDLQPLKSADLLKIKNYFQSKKALLDKQKLGSEFYDKAKKDKLKTEMENAFRALKDLYEKREQKIINRALFTTRTDSKMKDTTNMLEPEAKLYTGLIQTLLAGNNLFFQEFENAQEIPDDTDEPALNLLTQKPVLTTDVDIGDESKEVALPIQQSAGTERMVKSAQPNQERMQVQTEAESLLARIANSNPARIQMPKPGQPLGAAEMAIKAVAQYPHHSAQRDVQNDQTVGYVRAPAAQQKEAKPITGTKVRFSSAVPQFLDEDMNRYGPFSPGDIASLPEELAQILLRQHKAELIN